MPRIAAALAVLVAVTFSIGFNISRYPAVWEMLGPAPPAFSQDSRQPLDLEPSPVAAAPELPVSPTAPADPLPASSAPLANRMPEPIAVCETDVSPPPDLQEPGPKPKRQKKGKAPDGYRVECDGDSCRLVAEQPSQPAPAAQVAADSGKTAMEDSGPAAVAPAAKYASVARADPAEAIRCDKPLVPLAKPPATEPKSGVAQTAEAPPAAGPAPLVRHLPPLESEWTPPDAGYVPSPDGPIPLYATTPFP